MVNGRFHNAAMLIGLSVLSACSGPGNGTPSADGPLPADSERWVSGTLHVHSEYSDGAGSVSDVAAAAAEAGLDFVVLTDHWSLDALVEGDEGYHDGVLMLVGVEATTEFGHVLGLDLPVAPLRFGREDAREALWQIHELGGFALVAHPDSSDDSLRWTGWELPGYEGFEVFNVYAAYSRKGVFQSLAYLFLNPYFEGRLAPTGMDLDGKLVEKWDAMLENRKLAVWAGADAHGGLELSPGYFLRWPSYERVFRLARNYLLLEEPLSGVLARDRRLIYDALRAGRGYIALDDHPGSARFRFWAETTDEQWPMGSDIAFDAADPIQLRLTLSEPGTRLMLLGDGKVIARSEGGELSVPVDAPGIYRAEARRVSGDQIEPWLISNPIAILPGDQLAARREAIEPLEVAETMDEPALPYAVEFDADAIPDCAGIELEPGVFGPGSFRVRFTLPFIPRGEPDTANAPFGRCTIANRDERDLSGYAGLRFDVRSDAIYRVTLFLADREGDERTANIWKTSFLTRPQWREVTIPFSQLLGSAWLDPRVDLSDASEISFFFDTSNTRPGTTGEIELRNFSVVPVG